VLQFRQRAQLHDPDRKHAGLELKISITTGLRNFRTSHCVWIAVSHKFNCPVMSCFSLIGTKKPPKPAIDREMRPAPEQLLQRLA